MEKSVYGIYQHKRQCLRFKLIVVLWRVLFVTLQAKHFTLVVMIKPLRDIDWLWVSIMWECDASLTDSLEWKEKTTTPILLVCGMGRRVLTTSITAGLMKLLWRAVQLWVSGIQIVKSLFTTSPTKPSRYWKLGSTLPKLDCWLPPPMSEVFFSTISASHQFSVRYRWAWSLMILLGIPANLWISLWYVERMVFNVGEWGL